MLLFEQILPQNHIDVLGCSKYRLYNAFAGMMLARQPWNEWTRVLGTALEMRIKADLETVCVAFQKDNETVYIHILCFDPQLSAFSMWMVEQLYAKYRSDTPIAPRRRCWIHSIPLGNAPLSEMEVILNCQLARYTFARLYPHSADPNQFPNRYHKFPSHFIGTFILNRN